MNIYTVLFVLFTALLSFISGNLYYCIKIGKKQNKKPVKTNSIAKQEAVSAELDKYQKEIINLFSYDGSVQE